MSQYQDIQSLLEDDPDEAHRKCRALLDADPDDALALFLMGTIEARAERFGLAVNIFRRVVDLKPDRAEAWNNVGMAFEGLHKPAKAREAFMAAWNRSKTAGYAGNIALTYLEERQYTKTLEWCEKAFKIDPEHSGAKTQYGMA